MRFIQSDHDPLSFSSGAKVTVSYAHDVPPVIQNGPMCGLVSITLAAQLLYRIKEPSEILHISDKFHPENILEYAITNGLSKKGEMFSSDVMKQLIETHLPCRAEIINIKSPNTLQELLSEVILGHSTVLVPYDADKNHSPCLARGHKAHWCLVVGVCLVLDSIAPLTLDLLKCCQLEPGSLSHYVLCDDSTEAFSQHIKTNPTVSQLLECNHVYVFARHGKSSHLGLWSLRDLMRSNDNLIEVDPQRSNQQEYVIPSGGLEDGLKNKIVLVTLQ